MAQLALLLGGKKLKAERVSLCALLAKAIDQRDLLDAAAHRSATSLLNLLKQPTEAQAKAGNYKKGHVKISGLDITIENPAGSYRKPEWPPMQAHYGYFKGTEGADGDHVDVFIRPSTPTDWDGMAYIVDQVDAAGNFDEHKVLLGYDNQDQATKAYLAHYPKGWRLGEVSAMPVADLKTWLKSDTTEPLVLKRADLRAINRKWLLNKEWSQPTRATSGINEYGSKPRRSSRSKRRGELR